jgi:Skp family chaperone for outer membrane proteins
MAHSLNNGEDKIKELTYDYNFMKTKLDNDYTQSNRDINEQIWKRLNPLLDEYGKKKKLHLIIGANGMGSVLYNDEYYERTNDVISYINKKYYEGN